MSQTKQPGIEDYLRMARRRAGLIAVVMILAPLASFAYSRGLDERWEGSVDVFISTGSDARGNAAVLGGSPFPDRALATQATLARSPEVLRRMIGNDAAGEFGLEGLVAASSVEPTAGSDILRFSFEAGRAGVAQRLAHAYAGAFIEFRSSVSERQLDVSIARTRRSIARIDPEKEPELLLGLRQQLTEMRGQRAIGIGGANLVKSEIGPVKIQPNPTHAALIGLLGGAALAALATLFFEALDRRVRGSGEAAVLLGAPPLAALPHRPRELRGPHLSIASDRASETARAVRLMRVNVGFALDERQAETVLVTGADFRAGTTTAICELAAALAMGRRRVALVDMNVRRPDVHNYFQIDPLVGIGEVLGGSVSLGEALVEVKVPSSEGRRGGLVVLPARPGAFAIELGMDPRIEQLLGELEQSAEIVLIDSPPILEEPDTLALAHSADGVIVVVRSGGAHRESLIATRRQLGSASAKLLGFIETDAPSLAEDVAPLDPAALARFGG